VDLLIKPSFSQIASPLFTPEPLSPSWSLCRVLTGRLQEQPYKGKTWETAIFKTATDDLVQVGRMGIRGDERTGYDADRALCCHPSAHYAYWNERLNCAFPLGFFGENLTLDGLLDEDLCIGDVIRCGTVLMQVTQPRTPCYKQARKVGIPEFVKLIMQSERLGFLMRVLEPGTLTRGDQFALIDRPNPAVTLTFINRKRYEPDDFFAAAYLARLPELSHDWRAAFAKITGNT